MQIHRSFSCFVLSWLALSPSSVLLHQLFYFRLLSPSSSFSFLSFSFSLALRNFSYCFWSLITLIQAYFSNASHFNLNSSIFFSYCHLIHLQISSVPFLLENEIRSLNVRYVNFFFEKPLSISISIPKQINWELNRSQKESVCARSIYFSKWI